MTAVAEHKVKKPKTTVEKMQAIAEADSVVAEIYANTPAKPGESGFDWSGEYPGEKVFVYTADGVSVGLAAISKKRQPSIGFLRATRKKPEFEQVLDMLEFIASDTALALVDDWVPTDLLAMFEDWSDWNRANAGE